MTETIILAPGAGSSELLRTLAKFGKNTLGLRVLSRTELAKYALMKNGISITEEFLTAKEEPSVIFSFLNEINYFKAASFADAESLSSALSTMRSLIPSDEENELKGRLASGEFPEKNAAILEVYERFLKKCSEDDRIDSISLVRKAIEETEVVTSTDYLMLSEYPLMPLDMALIEAVSGGSYKEISLVDLFEREKKDTSDLSFTEGYGRINEAEDILDGIFRNEIPLDKCVIAATDVSSYAQVFYDLACSYDIPVTYGCGVPILNSNPARMLKLIYEWKTKGYYGIDALRRIINSDAFDRKEFAKTLGMDDVLSRKDEDELAMMAGSIRLSFDAAENRKRLDSLKAALDKEAADASASGNTKNIKRAEYRLRVYEWTAKLSDALSHGCTYFLSKYVLIRTDASGRVTNSAGRIDQSAVNVITESLDAYMHYAPDGDIDEIIPEVLNRTVCSENSREGCLHITSIAGAIACMRENLYVCGLSSSEFPGSPTENYLLLDSDLSLLAAEEIAPTSENRIRRNVRSLYDLLDLASALDVKTHLSYSGYSLSELKEQNPSSVLFSIYERIDPDTDMKAFKNALRQAPYFGSAISADRIIGAEYSKGAVFRYEGCPADKKDAAFALNRAWSPSALSNYLQCPRHFYLENVLGIKVNEDDDPFEVFSAAVTGSLAHTMMEKLAAENYSREDFLEASFRAFDEALTMRPPVHPSDADALKKDFLKMMETSFDKDPRNTVLSAEEEYTFDHPSGIKIHGYPDRVEQDADGKYLIADFKTKRKIEHEQDDFSTCMQVVVYAWLCEQAGIDISQCEYRYLRKGKTVTCRYDDEMRDQLGEFLNTLKESIENNDFPRNENEISCKYCKLADICKWPEDESGKEGGADE